MIPIRELRHHENDYHSFVRMVAGAAISVMVLAAIVIFIIAR